MNEKTLTALQGSIKKWEDIVNGTGADEGCDNCPLCLEFMDGIANDPEWAQDGCAGCPVAQSVGDSSCSRTPYAKWASYGYNYGENRGLKTPRMKVFDDKSKELAQAELDFLRSLLPHGDGG